MTVAWLSVALAVLIAIGLAAAFVWAALRRRRPDGEGEFLRAGRPEAVTQDEAARRATGSQAWMRPDGGGF